MSAIVVPSGMLRISKGGETDRVVYPVHADGWRTLGWTVHPPVLELEEEDQPPYLGVDGSELLPAADEAAGDGAVVDVLDFEGLTKPEILEAAELHFGVKLDGRKNKDGLLREVEALQAEALEAAALGGPAEPDGPSTAAVVDGEAALDAEVLDPGGADQAVVPDLQI